ncbi:hypothetical protein JTE90_026197 [Oedothorax gibbosus]|uniref:EGF-like domain-containing protein n=1 Tax=Oedothorax gibbosus TaxID=931172 RepID=A0AAV6TZS2_9ARAC|nr:hypothetical protein JTE90_026197 [Oedothorax gibbosus]
MVISHTFFTALTFEVIFIAGRMKISFYCTFIFLLILSKKVPQLHSLKIYSSVSEEQQTAIQCLTPHLCHPGICIVKNNKETCLCPKRYIALDGLCKYMGNCHDIDCKPGFCIAENETEKCYCPTGFTDKNNSCIEITFKNSSLVTTTMLMIIVAGSSITLSTFFGLCICYYHSKRNEIQ